MSDDRKQSYIAIDRLQDGVTLYVSRLGEQGVVVGLNARAARALANRILHELDYQDGKRSRRPSSPHLRFDEKICNRTGKALP